MRGAISWFIVAALFLPASCGGSHIYTAPTTPASANTKHLPAEISKGNLGVLELLKQKSLEARKSLESASVGPWCFQKTGKKAVPLGREVVLAGYSRERDNIEIVKIRLCYETPQELETLTKGYTTTWLRGNGITHFAFAIHKDNEQLVLLDSKQWMSETGHGEYYFPYTDDFLFMEIVADGARFLLSQIHKAQEELCALGVKSRADPKKTLCEIFHDDFIMNIALNEQMDKSEFRDACTQVSALPTYNRIFQNCAEYSVFKVLVHYARNMGDAFRYVGSRADAIGPMQFTRKTYREIALKDYPEAGIIHDFEIGARNLNNSIKAAICLLDRELSDMPDSIRALYAAYYRAGGRCLAGAYNGGRNRGLCLCSGKKSGECGASRNAWRETTGYIAKYEGIWYVIDNLVSLIKNQPHL